MPCSIQEQILKQQLCESLGKKNIGILPRFFKEREIKEGRKEGRRGKRKEGRRKQRKRKKERKERRKSVTIQIIITSEFKIGL